MAYSRVVACASHVALMLSNQAPSKCHVGLWVCVCVVRFFKGVVSKPSLPFLCGTSLLETFSLEPFSLKQASEHVKVSVLTRENEKEAHAITKQQHLLCKVEQL